MNKYLMVFEGPAGSGKTTIINRLAKEIEDDVMVLPRPAELLGVRSYRNEMAPMKADFDRLMTLLYSPYNNFMADRFWISSLIYQPLKLRDRYYSPASYPMPFMVEKDTKTLVSWAAGTMRTVDARDIEIKVPDYLRIDFYMLLPSTRLLLSNRKKADREYPFDAEIELAFYTNYAKNWGGTVCTPTVEIVLWPFEIYTIDDYSKVIRKAKFMSKRAIEV